MGNKWTTSGILGRKKNIIYGFTLFKMHHYRKEETIHFLFTFIGRMARNRCGPLVQVLAKCSRIINRWMQISLHYKYLLLFFPAEYGAINLQSWSFNSIFCKLTVLPKQDEFSLFFYFKKEGQFLKFWWAADLKEKGKKARRKEGDWGEMIRKQRN